MGADAPAPTSHARPDNGCERDDALHLIFLAQAGGIDEHGVGGLKRVDGVVHVDLAVLLTARPSTVVVIVLPPIAVSMTSFTSPTVRP